MALSERQILSRPHPIEFAGWRSNTYALYKAGWEFSVEQGWNTDRLNLLMRHRGLQMIMRAEESSFSIARSYAARDEPITFKIKNVVCDIHVLRTADLNPMDYTPMNANPQMVIVDEGSISKFNIFATAETKVQEIIVEPKDVAECLAIIQKLQAPDLQRIRERNRQRDDSQVLQARILSVA